MDSPVPGKLYTRYCSPLNWYRGPVGFGCGGPAGAAPLCPPRAAGACWPDACRHTRIVIKAAHQNALRMELPSVENFACCIIPTRAHHAASGMSRGSAQVQASYRRAVFRISRSRPKKEEIPERHRTLENVTAREHELPLDIQR